MTIGRLLSETRSVLGEHHTGRRVAYALIALSSLALLVPNSLAGFSLFLITAALAAAAFGLDTARGEVGNRVLSDGPKVLASTLLVGGILLFLAVMTLLASGLAGFAIMSGSGFDFDAASQGPEAYEAVMAAYQQTPGWQVAMVTFFIALALFATGVARALPFAAASAQERRVVALEAFNWSRKKGAKLLFAVGILCGPCIGAVFMAHSLFEPGLAMVVQVVAVAFALFFWLSLSLASYRVLAGAKHNIPVSS